MKLIRLVIGGIKGRKRDSLVMVSILLLAFLFLTLSSILLSSFTATADVQRKALHGRWQALYYGADDDTAERCAALTDCGVISLVGKTKDERTIGTADSSVLTVSGLGLDEGRLPESEDEIVLVRGRMASDPALGETIDVTYVYDYMKDDRTSSSFSGGINAILASVKETMTGEDRENYRTYLLDHYDPETNTVTFEDSGLWNFGFWGFESGSDYKISLPDGSDLDRMPAFIEDDLLYTYAQLIYGPEKFGSDPYKISRVLAKPGDLLGFEGFRIIVQREGFREDYVGKGFAESLRSHPNEDGLETTLTTMYKTYTVVGYVAPYADHWDVHGLSMPDAFVSPAAADSQLRALRYAEQYYTGERLEYTPSSILLLGAPDGTPRETAELTLPVYRDAQEPYFRMEGFVTGSSGEENGFITGTDPVTGREKSCQIMINRGAGYKNYAIRDDEGIWIGLSGDPSSKGRWEEISQYLLPLNPTELTFEEIEQNNVYTYRLNNYSYPPAGNPEQSLQLLCGGILVGVALFSVFQVFWVQLRRRRMRLATMMSVGATDGQVLLLLLYEVLILLAVSLVVGTAAGFGIARLVTAVAGAVFVVDIQYLTGGVLCCIGAVLLGALVPMLLVLHVPLTGGEQASRRVLQMKAPRRRTRQDYRAVLLRHMAVNRGRTLLQIILAWFLMTAGLITVFLCHSAYGDYRKNVTDTAKPDYEIVAPYGMSLRFTESCLEEAEGLTGGSRVSVTTEAPNVWLHCDELIEKSPVIRALRDIPEAQPIFRGLDGGRTGMAVRVIGVTRESDVLASLLKSLPRSAVDLDELERGESCILLVPRYMPDGDGVARKNPDDTVLESLRADERAGYLLDLCFLKRYRSVTREDGSVLPGDSISLTAYRQRVTETQKIEDSVTLRPRVAAVIDVLDRSIWPVSETNAPFTVVSGVELVTSLYRSASNRMTAEQARYHRKMAEIFYPDCYGLTRFNVYNLSGSDPVAQDTAAADFAEDLGFDFTNRRIGNERERSTAQRKEMMLLLLGIEMALVVLTLLFSTADVAAEHDRYRVGALQALGVSDRRINRGQIVSSLAVAAAACIAANLTLLIVQAAAALASAAPWVTFQANLNGYPWWIHLLVAAILTLLYTAVNSLPIRRISKLDPIENIRS